MGSRVSCCSADPREGGSILMLVLLMCLAAAVVVQILVAVVMCAERALGDELAGRARMAEKDAGLVALRQQALRSWQGTPWREVLPAGGAACAVDGALSEPEDDQSEWVLCAAVCQALTASHWVVSALVERGREGIDLPWAAVVAGSVSVSAGRDNNWLEAELALGGGSGAGGRIAGPLTTTDAYVGATEAASLIDAGCALRPLERGGWGLDAGWRVLVECRGGDTCGMGSDVLTMTARPGRTVRIPDEFEGGLSSDRPVLIVVTGGGDLDATGLGDLYGVVAVDEGSVALEATRLHGAAFVSEVMDLGATGKVLFSRVVLRWASDRSLTRTRLVPGSRREKTE